MYFEYDEYLDWLQAKHLEETLGTLELWTEDTPLGLWLKERLGVESVYLCTKRFLKEGEWVDLPAWAVANETLSQELLEYGQPVLVGQALWIADLAIRAVVEKQSQWHGEKAEVVSGV